MKILSIFWFFLLIFASINASGQECLTVPEASRQAIVSLKVFIENKETGETRTVYGTGFIITPDGHLLTAYHVVSGDVTWKVNDIQGAIGSLNGQYSALRYVDNDRIDKDIALLQFKDTSRTYATVRVGKPGNVKTGKRLCSVSYSFPLNFDYFPSNFTFTGKRDDRWAADTPSNVGESGAPVFNDATGRVVAMRYGILKVSEIPVQNVGLLTPLNYAKTMLESYCDIELTDN